MIAAKRLFSEKGYEKSTMEDIAREAELSAGTLYLYFKNKDDLYASLCIRMLQYINVKIGHVVKQSGLDYYQKQQVLMETLFDVYHHDPLILNNMFHLQSSETLHNLGPEIMSEITSLARKSLRSMATLFEDGIRRKKIIPAHPTALADILWGMFSGIVLWEESKKMISKDRYNLKQTMQTAIEIMGRGLKRDRTPETSGSE
jgi:AcrR family transcriptional regulator